MQLKDIEAAGVVHQIKCDRCDKKVLRGETGFSEMTSIGFDAGEGSIFGEGKRVEIDLCETCLCAALGAWLRVQPAWNIDQMPREGVAAADELRQSAAGHQDHDRFKHEYGALTLEEIAGRMKCMPEVVREREAAGELFAARAPGRDGGPCCPECQLNEQLARPLLRQIIKEYRDAEVSTTLLWRFLRSPQKFLSGFTPVEILLGCSFPEYDALTPEKKCTVFLDFVTEELSQARL